MLRQLPFEEAVTVGADERHSDLARVLLKDPQNTTMSRTLVCSVMKHSESKDLIE
jgi:hypothetical protein